MPCISEAEAIAALGLSQEQWEAILDMVNHEGVDTQKHGDKRRFNRTLCFGLIPFILEQRSMESTACHKIVYVHNISAKGLGLIHIGPLPPAMACNCWPRESTHDAAKTLSGVVRWCKQLTGHIHMSGVELDGEIVVEQFIS